MTPPVPKSLRCPLRLASAALAMLMLSTGANAAPLIRTTDGNRMPACVTPERLMAFLGQHNERLDPKYREIARWYKYWGEAWHVRWDYAFYQMVLETNYLKFRRGDVNEKQNNFAGLGGAVPGERFADIKTGVLAQIQHLVAYSGEHLATPVAQRTQLKQDDIITQSRRLRRAVTFGDLAHRWAADRAYGRSIDVVAELYRRAYCTGTEAAIVAPAPVPRPTRSGLRNFPPPSGLGGPKPQMLAGPDPLPWQETQASELDGVAPTAPQGASPSSKATPSTPETSPPATAGPKPAQHRPPVRTIWSREGALNTKAQPVPQAAAPAQPAQPAPPQPAAAPAPQASSEPAPVTSATPAPAATLDEPVKLPEFKIRPDAPPPQRLGGPIAPPTPAGDAGTKASVQPVAPKRETPNSSQRMGLAGPPPAPAAPQLSGKCRVLTASYGGKKTLLVRAVSNGETRLTALTVLDGFEKSMFDIYAKANAPDAELIGEYPSKDDALADARANCPGN